MTELTISLSDEVYSRVAQLAKRTGQPASIVAAMMLDFSLTEMDTRPIDALPDSELLALADSMMDRDQNVRFSTLQDKQQSGTLTDSERLELTLLLEIYNAGQLRKARAMAEAAKRNLPLSLE